MNVELLRKIAQVIQERPAEFNMDDFAVPSECGSVCCIGGWAMKLSGLDELNTDPNEAAKLLGINSEQADRLFYPSLGGRLWPYGFGDWDATPAQAAARIEHFIATEGRE